MPYESLFLFCQWKSIRSEQVLHLLSLIADPHRRPRNTPSEDKPGTKSSEGSWLLQVCKSSGFAVHYNLPLTLSTTLSTFRITQTKVGDGPCSLLTDLAMPRCQLPSLPQRD